MEGLNCRKEVLELCCLPACLSACSFSWVHGLSSRGLGLAAHLRNLDVDSRAMGGAISQAGRQYLWPLLTVVSGSLGTPDHS